MSELRVNTITEASTGTGITFTNSIVSGNLGTITQRSASSSSPTFSDDQGNTYTSTRLGNLFGNTTSIIIGDSNEPKSTHAWIAWDYGSGNARKLTKLHFFQDSGALDSTGIFLEGSNVDSPDYTETDYTGDWTQLKSFGNIVNDTVYSYSSPVTATTLKYRHYRIRYSWSSGNYCYIRGFVLEDTDSTFDARAALNATGDAPIYACRAWVNFDGNGTVPIRTSGNVSSITDVGQGRYILNFTTDMPDANYVVAGTAGNATGTTGTARSINRDGEWTSSQANIRCVLSPSSNVDDDYVVVAIFR